MIDSPIGKIQKARAAIRNGIDGWFQVGDGQGDTRTTSHDAPRGEAHLHMTIRKFMTPDPATIRIRDPLHRAIGVMIEKDFSALPVIDDDDSVVGLLNERHLLKALGDHAATTVAAVMDRDVVTVGVDESIVEAVDRLMVINVRQVIVLEGSKLVGVITRADLMPGIREILQTRAVSTQSPPLEFH